MRRTQVILLLSIWILLIQQGFASLLYLDHFSNNNLAINPDTGGGAIQISNREGTDGFTSESDGVAEVHDGSTPNISGIRSLNYFDVSGGCLATWQIGEYTDPKNWAYIGLGFLQKKDLPEATLADITLLIKMDLANDVIQLITGENQVIDQMETDLSFSDADGFTLSAEFTTSGYTVWGYDIWMDGTENPATNIIFSGSWGSGYSLNTFFGDKELSITELVSANGNNTAPYNVESVTLQAIPEPTAMMLIGTAGIGLIVIRRFWNRA